MRHILATHSRTLGIALGLAFVTGLAAQAQTVVPTQTIRPGTILTTELLRQTDAPSIAGTVQTVADIIGQQARTALYINRPILLSQVTRPKTIERNDIVTLIFESGSLQITGEGRALDPGITDERIRVMNLSSRQIVTGHIVNKNTVRVF